MPLALEAARPVEAQIFHGPLREGLQHARQLPDGTFVGPHTPPDRPRGRERIPRVDLRRTKLTGRGAAALAAAAAVPMAARDTQRLHQHPDRRPSAGRLAAGSQFGAYHAAIAGKPGHKLRAAAPYVPVAIAGNYVTRRAMFPHLAAMQRDMYAGAHPDRVLGHVRGAMKAGLPVAAAGMAANALITRHNASLGRYKEQTMAKSDTIRRDASPGRYVAGTMFPGWHGAIAGRPGRKLRAAGTELTPAAAAAAGMLALSRKPEALAVGAGALRVAQLAGHVGAVQHNQRRGNYKPQAVTASKRLAVIRKDMLPTHTRYVVARTPDGRYAGNGNDLTFVQIVTRHRKGSDTAPTVVHRGPGRSGGRAAVSVAHGSVAKAANPLAFLRAGARRTAMTDPAVQRGLDQITRMRKPTAVPKTNLTKPLASRLSGMGTSSSGRRIG